MDHSELNDEKSSPPIVVVILDHDECRLGTAVEYDSAITLRATMSEDPANWDEVAGYWARYRCPAVCEFVDGLPIRRCDRDVALAAIDGHGNWLAIDLVQKRVATGIHVQPLGREATLALVTAENGKQHCPLPFHLPPWWELHEAATADVVSTRRESEIQIPRTNRPFLFGSPMIEDLAGRIMRVVADVGLPDETTDEYGPSLNRHARTVEVHRDWLMTPREDLAGRRPRDLLHGAHDWSDAIIWSQRMRFEDGAPMTAAPDDVLGYADAPMGREEMIVYFDLCREVIASGWFWCEKDIEASQETSSNRLTNLMSFLSDVRDSWLEQPFEGGSLPSFIIECSRRRVPRGSQVPIMGMDGEESEQHVPDCDCPICDMMASGMFGVGFTSLDGHHLDLDNEFAFSTHEFIEDWEREQEEYRAFNEKFNREQAEREARIAAGERKEDVYASAWSSPMTNDKLPGDRSGHLKLSFRLAEIIGDLERAGAPSETIKNLNGSFREYRESATKDRQAARADLGTHLDDVAQQYPELLPKIADFQSQVDELQREPAEVSDSDWSVDDDFPF